MQRTLRTLEQNVRSRCDRAVDHKADILGDRKNAWCETLEQLDGRIDVRPVAHSE